MDEKIIILDFGSQTTQLIGRRIRELNTYCEIVPYNKFPFGDETVKGIILSGSPFSVNDENAFKTDLSAFRRKYPVLGICYGAQLIAQSEGANLSTTDSREYGRAELTISAKDKLFEDISEVSTVWMSHGDTITNLPSNFQLTASTVDVEVAAYQIKGEPTWGVQFHPEVVHTEEGKKILSNFLNICGCKRNWTPASFVK